MSNPSSSSAAISHEPLPRKTPFYRSPWFGKIVPLIIVGAVLGTTGFVIGSAGTGDLKDKNTALQSKVKSVSKQRDLARGEMQASDRSLGECRSLVGTLDDQYMRFRNLASRNTDAYYRYVFEGDTLDDLTASFDKLTPRINDLNDEYTDLSTSGCKPAPTT